MASSARIPLLPSLSRPHVYFSKSAQNSSYPTFFTTFAFTFDTLHGFSPAPSPTLTTSISS
ncbi:MAG: hypothetical protein Q9224_005765, partial [Gallowayella concinna]